MEIILLEKSRLGQIGDTATVKNGYARNFLIPNRKAVRATAENKKTFELQKASLQKEFDSKKAEAEKIKLKLNDKHLILVRQCGEDSRLYGSVNTNDILKAIKEQLGQDLPKSAITLVSQIKYTGVYNIPTTIFSDVQANLKLAIGRSEEEAKLEFQNESANKLKKEAEAALKKQIELDYQGEPMEELSPEDIEEDLIDENEDGSSK